MSLLSPTRSVSVILTTHDRPTFLAMALACYRHQTYEQRELIVVDDSVEPIDTTGILESGGRLMRVAPGTPLGTKLNRGMVEARGALCQKMDDDDWYGPDFVEQMARTFLSTQTRVCRPAVAFLSPYRFFDVARWAIHENREGIYSGGTLMIANNRAEDGPFRPIPAAVDKWLVVDQCEAGAMPVPVRAADSFLQVRHGGDHTWTEVGAGHTVEDYLRNCPVYQPGPESLLPTWALTFYRQLQQTIRR